MLIITDHIRYAKFVINIRCRVSQKYLRPSSPIVQGSSRPGSVSVDGSRIPPYPVCGGTGSCAGGDAIIGVVGYGIELIKGGETKDLAAGRDFVVVGQVTRGV